MPDEYVLVTGSIREGITSVVGPFRTFAAVYEYWEENQLDYFPSPSPDGDAIFKVHSSNQPWGDRSIVDVHLNGRGGVAGVYGPSEGLFRFKRLWAVSCVLESPEDFARRMRGGDEA